MNSNTASEMGDNVNGKRESLTTATINMVSDIWSGKKRLSIPFRAAQNAAQSFLQGGGAAGNVKNHDDAEKPDSDDPTSMDKTNTIDDDNVSQPSLTRYDTVYSSVLDEEDEEFSLSSPNAKGNEEERQRKERIKAQNEKKLKKIAKKKEKRKGSKNTLPKDGTETRDPDEERKTLQKTIFSSSTTDFLRNMELSQQPQDFEDEDHEQFEKMMRKVKAKKKKNQGTLGRSLLRTKPRKKKEEVAKLE